MAIVKIWFEVVELMVLVLFSYLWYDIVVNRVEIYQKYSDIVKKEVEKILGREQGGWQLEIIMVFRLMDYIVKML